MKMRSGYSSLPRMFHLALFFGSDATGRPSSTRIPRIVKAVVSIGRFLVGRSFGDRNGQRLINGGFAIEFRRRMDN
ncbi:MAG: hypothetical protein JWN70_1322 [Planctomycetaceae bacterium]|nr:hypothetical protein [Planctomycetaceae bacterium]